MLRSALLALVFLLGACDDAKSGPPVEVMYTGPNDRAAAVRQAIDVLFKSCRNLELVRRDIIGMDADYKDYRTGAPYKMAAKSILEIRVSFRPEPISSAEASRLLGRGEVAHFDLVGGANPTVAGAKRSGRWLCDFAPDHPAEDAIKAVPELHILDAGLPSLLSPDGHPPISFSSRPAETELMRKALPVLLKICPRVETGYPGMEWMGFMMKRSEPGSLAKLAGWDDYLKVTVAFFDNSMVLDPPLANTKGSRYAEFALSSAPRPGIVPLDASARALCGRDPDEKPYIINASGLRFLSELRQVRLSETRTRPMQLDSTAHPLRLEDFPVPPGHSRNQPLSKMP